MATSDTIPLLNFAHRLADLARPITLQHFRALTEVENKNLDAFDPVTQADRDAEAAIRDAIREQFPEHGILGEEFSDESAKNSQGLRWIIDPIDGTRSYIAGKPNWGTLIGLYAGEDPVLGLVDMPALDERVWATTHGPAESRRLGRDQPIATRACASPDQAILATTSPEFFTTPPIAALWAEITSQMRLTLYGGDCTNYALLASGHIDCVIERDLNPYDILPLRCVIEAAGGVITDWQGEAVSGGGHVIACGDRHLHAALLPLLCGAA